LQTMMTDFLEPPHRGAPLDLSQATPHSDQETPPLTGQAHNLAG
jgi:hypothetical protein